VEIKSASQNTTSPQGGFTENQERENPPGKLEILRKQSSASRKEKKNLTLKRKKEKKVGVRCDREGSDSGVPPFFKTMKGEKGGVTESERPIRGGSAPECGAENRREEDGRVNLEPLSEDGSVCGTRSFWSLGQGVRANGPKRLEMEGQRKSPTFISKLGGEQGAKDGRDK